MVYAISKLRKGVNEEKKEEKEVREILWKLVKRCENSIENGDCLVRAFLREQDPANMHFTGIFRLEIHGFFSWEIHV